MGGAALLFGMGGRPGLRGLPLCCCTLARARSYGRSRAGAFRAPLRAPYGTGALRTGVGRCLGELSGSRSGGSGAKIADVQTAGFA